MAKPTVFVSSTYYDLKYVRASLETFISSLGFDSVLSERGDITYGQDVPIDVSCYREISNADIFVLIIGGRYGAQVSAEPGSHSPEFWDFYTSITRKEFQTARDLNLPIYVLIDESVYAEYNTYTLNRMSDAIRYASVTSVNVFRFIDEILEHRLKYPMIGFSRYSEIEDWLRRQWAGLLYLLLRRSSQDIQMGLLSAQLSGLFETNQVMTKYLDRLVAAIAPEDSTDVLNGEKTRLRELDVFQKYVLSDASQFLSRISGFSIEETFSAVISSASFDEIIDKLSTTATKDDMKARFLQDGTIREKLLSILDNIRHDLNLAHLGE